MAKRTLETKFFRYRQNNSGGSFDIDDKRGIGVVVLVEGLSASDADNRAETIGLYWNGCDSGLDCPCCGDRWSPTWEDGKDEPEISLEWDFTWHDTAYVHRMDGSIERITKAAA